MGQLISIEMRRRTRTPALPDHSASIGTTSPLEEAERVRVGLLHESQSILMAKSWETAFTEN